MSWFRKLIRFFIADVDRTIYVRETRQLTDKERQRVNAAFAKMNEAFNEFDDIWREKQ